MKFVKLNKLRSGDAVAVLSPCFVAPARWPHVYRLGLERLKSVFGLFPVEYQSTTNGQATHEEKIRDLESAFRDPKIKAVITTIGGDEQVTHVKHFSQSIFREHPKPFFGYSDHSHFINHLWLQGVPTYYGGGLFTEFAMQGEMDAFTIKYLKHAFFDTTEVFLESSPEYNDIGLDWSNPKSLSEKRRYQKNDGWFWDGVKSARGITWGGCLESIDEMLRHNSPIPNLDQFSEIVLCLETSEELPSHGYVYRVLRALGERGILARIKGLLVGRPKAWEFGAEKTDEQKVIYQQGQRDVIQMVCRQYNSDAPIVQNLDFGHTAPQICLPMGKEVCLDSTQRLIKIEF